MHYKVRDIRVRDGVVCVIAAESDVRNTEFMNYVLEDIRDESVHKQLVETGRLLYCGDFQFLKNSKSRAKKVYERCKQRHGTFRSHYGDRDGKKYRERFASEFARRMCA